MVQATAEKLKTEIEKVAVYLRQDGGDIDFVSYDEPSNTAYVRLQGACCGCPGAQMTLKMGVERQLQKVFPNITVKAV